MKLSLHPKSFFNSTSIYTKSHSKNQAQQSQLSLSDPNKHSSLPKSESDECLHSYLDFFPQHKKKHNISIFNFFAKRMPKKSKDSTHENFSQSKSSKTSFSEGNFVIKKMRQPYPSLSGQKLRMLHLQSNCKLSKSILNMEKAPQQFCKDEIAIDKNNNKINENLSKNVKFDRKKYIYYRYRKRMSSQKNDISVKNIPQNKDLEKPKLLKRPFTQFNIKTDNEMKNFQQFEQNDKNVGYKYSFCGVFPAKNQSFSQVKCRLTIQPMPRQTSYRLIDRQSLTKTTRQMRHKKQEKKQMKKNGAKVFSQAIHFKNKKKIQADHQQQKVNPEKRQHFYKQEQILGWNLGEQNHQQQIYF